MPFSSNFLDLLFTVPVLHLAISSDAYPIHGDFYFPSFISLFSILISPLHMFLVLPLPSEYQLSKPAPR
jgi:hypothetical protein